MRILGILKGVYGRLCLDGIIDRNMSILRNPECPRRA